MRNINQVCSTDERGASIPFARKALSTGIASLLVATATLSVLAPHAAFAQTAQTQTTTAQQDIEEIAVTGIRFSQRSALDRKKEAGTMTDSLVAEDIGAFPDKNIAEALQRIPGIQLNREDGEGSTVSIRGVDPDLLRVEVNNVGAMGSAGSRAVDFRDMASELVKSLDVIKGSEARLTEGGIGGTIQVNTRKPNEFKDNFLSVSGEGQYNDLIGDFMPKVNLTGVYKPTDRLGVLVNLTASDKTTIIHALRNTEWSRFGDYDNDPAKTTVNPDFEHITNFEGCASYANPQRNECQTQWYEFSPYLPRYGIWERAEKRLSANTMVEYAFTDNLSGHIGYTYNNRDKTAHDLNLQFESTSTARLEPNSIVVDKNKNVVAYETSNAIISNRAMKFAWDQKTSMLETGFDYKSDSLDIAGILATSKSDQDIDSTEAQVVAQGIGGIKVSLNNAGLPDINVDNAYYRNADNLADKSNKFDINDLASYNNRARYKYAPSTDETQEDMGKLDITFRPNSEVIKSFRSGIQVTQQSFANNNYEFNIIRDQGVNYNGQLWTAEDHANLVNGNVHYSPELFKGYSLPVGALNNFAVLNTHSFIKDLQSLVADNTTRNDLDSKIGNFDVEVDTRAIYFQADFATEFANLPLTGNVGVRYVETDTAANGDVRIRVIVDQLDENGKPMVDPITGAYLGGIEDPDHPQTFLGRKTVKSDYNDVLPSLNLSLGLIPDELELYFGAAKVMARPRITDINVNANCTIYKNTTAIIDNDPNVCSGGNPFLDPYRATQMELAINWYPDENSILSASYFTKDISSFILDADTNYNVDFFGDGQIWDVKQKLNGEGVDISGVELQASTMLTWLPGIWSGFGGSANYTYMKSDNVGLFNKLTGEELPFPSQSKDSYNITIFYETDVWSARAAYNYRSEFLSSPSDRSGNPAFTQAAGYLDAKFSYDIAPNLKFHIDARNLTGEVKSVNAGPGRLSTYDWSGREYSMGISWKM